MDDYVGDILAQRAKLESGAGAAIFVSLVLHGILSALAVWSAWHATVQQTPSVINIRLARPAPAAEMTPAAPAVTAPQAAPLQQPAPPKVVEKPKPEKKTVPFSPFGKSTKKGREESPRPTPAPAAPAPAAAPAAAAQDVPIGGAGVTGLEGGDFPNTLYIENMKRLIGARWYRPSIGGGAASVVYFVIQRDGTVRDAKTEVPSGSDAFDRAALSAVVSASPLPPLPFSYSGTYLGVHLKFR